MPSSPQFEGPRPIRPNEAAASRRLSTLCFGDHSMEDDAPFASAAARHPGRSQERMYVIAHEGVPVSQLILVTRSVSFFGAVVRVGQVGGVCTHSDYRGHGLAGRLLEDGTRRLRQAGARLLHISGGRGLYTRAGCVPAGRFVGFAFQSGRLPPPRSDVTLRRATPDDATVCCRFYHQEAAHSLRPVRDIAHAFRRPVSGYRAESWIVETDGRPSAYIVLNVPWEHVGARDAGVRAVFEYAGSKIALFHGLAAVLQQPGIRKLEVTVPWQDADLIDLLRPHAGTASWASLPDHTARVIDFRGLMRDLRPWLQSRLDPGLRRRIRFGQSGPLLGGNGGDRYWLACGRDRMELDGAALSALVIGSKDEGSTLAARAPGALRTVVDALFPLPSHFAGIDYH